MLHHIIPSEIYGEYQAFLNSIGYTQFLQDSFTGGSVALPDEVLGFNNRIKLPDNLADALANGDAIHLGPHPAYSEFVGNLVDKVQIQYYSDLRAGLADAQEAALQNIAAVQNYLRTNLQGLVDSASGTIYRSNLVLNTTLDGPSRLPVGNSGGPYFSQAELRASGMFDPVQLSEIRGTTVYQGTPLGADVAEPIVSAESAAAARDLSGVSTEQAGAEAAARSTALAGEEAVAGMALEQLSPVPGEPLLAESRAGEAAAETLAGEEAGTEAFLGAAGKTFLRDFAIITAVTTEADAAQAYVDAKNGGQSVLDSDLAFLQGAGQSLWNTGVGIYNLGSALVYYAQPDNAAGGIIQLGNYAYNGAVNAANWAANASQDDWEEAAAYAVASGMKLEDWLYNGVQSFFNNNYRLVTENANAIANSTEDDWEDATARVVASAMMKLEDWFDGGNQQQNAAVAPAYGYATADFGNYGVNIGNINNLFQTGNQPVLTQPYNPFLGTPDTLPSYWQNPGSFYLTSFGSVGTANYLTINGTLDQFINQQAQIFAPGALDNYFNYLNAYSDYLNNLNNIPLAPGELGVPYAPTPAVQSYGAPLPGAPGYTLPVPDYLQGAGIDADVTGSKFSVKVNIPLGGLLSNLLGTQQDNQPLEPGWNSAQRWRRPVSGLALRISRDWFGGGGSPGCAAELRERRNRRLRRELGPNHDLFRRRLSQRGR